MRWGQFILIGLRILLVGAILVMGLPAPAAAAPYAPYACAADGTQSSGAIYRICMPGLF